MHTTQAPHSPERIVYTVLVDGGIPMTMKIATPCFVFLYTVSSIGPEVRPVVILVFSAFGSALGAYVWALSEERQII